MTKCQSRNKQGAADNSSRLGPPVSKSQGHNIYSNLAISYLKLLMRRRDNFEGGRNQEAGLTLTVKSWTEVADDAAAMLKRTASGGGGLEESGRSGRVGWNGGEFNGGG